MDTSETYIKMRVKAISDLGMGTPPKVIPYHVLTSTVYVYVDSIGNFYCIYRQGKDDAVIGCQLERQDQLQEMVVFPDQPYYQIGRFSRVVGDWCKEGYLAHGASMEQLWLAFVMKEKYNKTWNGEEWTTK